MNEVFGEVSPVLVMAMVMGLVEFAKKVGVNGKGSMGLSMGLGVAFGVGYQVAEAGSSSGGLAAVSPAGWFGMAVFGLLMGLAVSGLYDLGKKFSRK